MVEKEETPKDPEPVYNPEGFWEPRTDEKNEQAGIHPEKK